MALKKIDNRRGAVLAISLLIVIVIVTLSTIYVFRAVHEKSMSTQEYKRIKTQYTAQAGGNAGLEQLNNLINTYLLNTVNATDPAVMAAQAANYVANGNSIGFLIAYTKNGNTSLLTSSASEAVYSGTSTGFDGGNYQYTIRIAAKGAPSTVTANVWDFPYYYRIQTTATQAPSSKKETLNGDFSVRVQKDNFARYALFTNTQTSASGNTIWFTNNTNFTGPLFTNGTFNFAYNPGATFSERIKQVNATARFYNNNNPILLNADFNGTKDVPTFQNGFTRSATTINMPSSSVESTMSSEASAGNTYSTNGIYIPSNAGALTGGVYVRGNASIALSNQGTDTSVMTITQGSQVRTIKVNKTTNQTTVTDQSNNTTTYAGVPDGSSDVGQIIYVKGSVTGISGTVQKDTQLTIATQDDLVIQDNIRYEQYTPGSGTPGSATYIPPSASGKNNLLGLISWQGNVRIGSSAPNNVEVHATVMAKQGVFTVDNYDTGSSRGDATVLGGVITNNYGAFGQFNSSTGNPVSGYGRNFVYDGRMESSMTPPYFPTMNTFIAFTDDINDKKFWQAGGF